MWHFLCALGFLTLCPNQITALPFLLFQHLSKIMRAISSYSKGLGDSCSEGSGREAALFPLRCQQGPSQGTARSAESSAQHKEELPLVNVKGG